MIVAVAALPAMTVISVRRATVDGENVAVTRAETAARAIASAEEIVTAAGCQVETAVVEAVVASGARGAIEIAITTDQTGTGPIGMIGQRGRTTAEVASPRTGASLRRTR